MVEYDIQGLPLGEMGARVKGFMDPNKRIIYNDRNRRIGCRRSILLHELIHAYKEINNLKDLERETSKLEREIYNQLYKNNN